MSTGSKIIDGLKDAVAGNFTRVHVEGFEWVRADHVASLIAENERLRAELRASDLMYVEMKQERDEAREHCERLAHASAKRAASEAINTNLRAALKDMIRMLEAVRYTSGLGKNQMKRIERAKALLSVKNPDQQSERI